MAYFYFLRSSLFLNTCLVLVALSAPIAHADTPLEREQKASPMLHSFLDKLTPHIDTSVPETVKQATLRIRGLLDQGQSQQALDALDQFSNQHQAFTSPYATENVQLLFLRARAFEQLQRLQEALAIYSQMTEQYPELPEPWNNLAAIYFQQNQLDLALDALQYALRIDPNFSTARQNLAKVYAAKAQVEQQRVTTQ